MQKENKGDWPEDCVIISTRLFNASPELLFSAFEQPEILASWWGPAGFTNSFEEFDFKPSGKWRFTMHGPDGSDYQNESVFESIIAPEQIVFTHLLPMHQFKMVIDIKSAGEQTLFSFSMLFENAEECNKIKAYVPMANEQNFDRLELAIEAMKAAK